MYTKLFSSIFNLSLEDFEDALSYQYSKEETSLTTDKTVSKEKTGGNGSGKQDLLAFVSDSAVVLEWNVFDDGPFGKSGILGNIDLDEIIRRLDLKIAQLEREERLETTEEDNCDDTEAELLRFVNSFRPQSGFSEYYSLLYGVAFLYKYCSQLEATSTDNSSKVTQMFSDCITSYPEAMIVNGIFQFITDCNRGTKRYLTIDISKDTSRYVNRICSRAFSKDNWTESDKKLLLLTIQLVALVKALINPSIQREAAFRLSAATISLGCANICYQDSDYENGILFALKALVTDNVADRQDAFNVLGLCAIDNKQYQLAYDAYYSWINMQIVGALKLDSSINDYFKSLEDMLNGSIEKEWRQKETKSVAIMYGNFAYVSGAMYDLIETSDQRDELIALAEYYINLAIERDPECDSYYCSAGTIHYDAQRYEEAVKYYKKYYDLAVKLADKVTALRSILEIYQKEPKTILNRDYETIETDFINLYLQLSSKNDAIDNDEIIASRDLYVMLSECALLSDKLKELKHTLLEIDNETRCILRILKRTLNTPPNFDLHLELLKQKIKLSAGLDTIAAGKNTKYQKHGQKSNEIAYYTTLRNLQFLFSETPQENGNTINCLTMMHARYMNDPDEGLIFLQKLQEYLPKAPEIMRNELYDQKFVFLKSFTGLVDQLNMWTMYGSDRNTGSDCNGCCVCLAPESFDKMPNKTNKQTNRLSFYEDDYHLYNVAYMEGEKIFVDGDRNKNIEKHYNRLKRMLAKISKRSVGVSSTDTDIISTCLVRMLEKLMFLFKDKSYHLEAESRLILTRDVKDRSEIKKTPQEPPKIFINPMFQVFPEKILLGPKVENPDYWIPHLQFELSKICEKWPPDSKRSYKPIVRKSRINIR